MLGLSRGLVALIVLLTPLLLFAIGAHHQIAQSLLERPASDQARFIKSLPTVHLDKPAVAAFERFNGGDWQQLCVVGPYGDALATFDAAFPGGRRGWASWRARIALPFLYFEKGAFVVVFADRFGLVEAYFVDGVHLEWWKQCLAR